MSKKSHKSALHVNKGIEPPSSLNREAIERLKKAGSTKTNKQALISGILNGNRTMLSKAITLVESSLPEHHLIAQEIIEACLPYSGNSLRLGVTGVPGVGKSTFIEALGKFLTTNNHKLAVLAIDPSSTQTKGSILGDKTRMEDLATDPQAFIRPSPTAGSLGGVARKTRESIILCEAAGFDIIFVETVGVGQSETAVHAMVDFFLLLMLAGAGDELQGIKRGIMEMADGIVINKADGDNIHKANRAKKEYENALHLFPPKQSGWSPLVRTCSAISKTGIENIWKMIMQHHLQLKENDFFEKHRQEQNKNIMFDVINERLKDHFYSKETIKSHLEEMASKVMNKKISSYQAASEILAAYFENTAK